MPQTGATWLGKKRTARILALVAEANDLAAGFPRDRMLSNGCSLVRGYAELVLGPQSWGDHRRAAQRLTRLWLALERMRKRFDELPPPVAPSRQDGPVKPPASRPVAPALGSVLV